MQEFGVLSEQEKNAYWKVNLVRRRLLIGGTGVMYKAIWYTLTLLMLVPLWVCAWRYAKMLKRKLRALPKETIPAIPFRVFVDVYPGCLYSPFIKGYELYLFSGCDLKEPVLEIGIGDGHFSSNLFKGKDVRLTYGADLIYETLKSARRYGHCDNFLMMDAFEIPFPDNSLNTVIMNNLMHHLPDRDRALKELLRVLKPRGKLIFTDNTIGWGTFTWEQRLLHKVKLDTVADKLLSLKLALFAQRLLVDDDYYEKKSNVYQYTIRKKIEFVSATSMYLSSIFEFLHLKQGQPTRNEMVRWMEYTGLKKKISCYMADILEYCHTTDSREGQVRGNAFMFLEIEKCGDDLHGPENVKKLEYVCPKCHGKLTNVADGFYCSSCFIEYPEIDGVPVFISYQGRLKGFDEYLKRKVGEKSAKYTT